LRLGQWIVDNHRIPTTELFSYTAHGHPLLAHEWLSDALFALLAGAGGLFLVALVMGAVAWSAMLATALRGRARGAGPLALALGPSVLAACVNPAGPLLYRFAVMTTATEGQKSIIEWQSPNFHDPGMWALLALLVTLAALPALGGRLYVRDATLAAAGTAMAL